MLLSNIRLVLRVLLIFALTLLLLQKSHKFQKVVPFIFSSLDIFIYLSSFRFTVVQIVI